MARGPRIKHRFSEASLLRVCWNWSIAGSDISSYLWIEAEHICDCSTSVFNWKRNYLRSSICCLDAVIHASKAQTPRCQSDKWSLSHNLIDSERLRLPFHPHLRRQHNHPAVCTPYEIHRPNHALILYVGVALSSFLPGRKSNPSGLSLGCCRAPPPIRFQARNVKVTQINRRERASLRSVQARKSPF